MVWSNELILEFLKLYEGEPCIWNPRDPSHKNRNLVHDAWKRIENRLSVRFTVSELKKKKDALMATYRKLSQKVNASGRLGESFQPDWFAYEYMYKFLHEIYRPSKRRNSEEFKEENDMYENNEWNEDDERYEDKSTESNIQKESNSNTEIPSTSADREGVFKSRISSGRKRKRKSQMITNIENRMEEAYKALKNFSKTETIAPDECSLYAELLAKKLRALDENTREIAMLQIDHLIYRLKQPKDLQIPLFTQT